MAAISQTTHSNTFLEWTCLHFDWNFTEVCSQGSIEQYASIGSDNGLAPNRRQAIIWTNDGLIWWRIYASLGLNELVLISITTSVADVQIQIQNHFVGIWNIKLTNNKLHFDTWCWIIFHTAFNSTIIDVSYSKRTVKPDRSFDPQNCYINKYSYAKQHQDDALGIRVFMLILF